MKHEVEGERAKVEESCKKAPVLNGGVLARHEGRLGGTMVSYLSFYPYCLKADEELKRGEKIALAEDRRRYDSCCPPPSNHRDIKEPLFQGCSHRCVVR